MSNIDIGYEDEDFRPAFILDDVTEAEFRNVESQRPEDVPSFVLKNVKDFSTFQCKPVSDTQLDNVEQKEL